MKLKDFNQLKKIMDRTLSENDHEALASLRAANKIIEKSGVTWGRFFDRAVRIDVEQDPERPVANNAKVVPDAHTLKVNTAFETIEKYDSRRYESAFIQSLLEQWSSRAWLSEDQLDRLFENERRATEM